MKQKARAEKKDHYQVLCDTLLEMVPDEHASGLIADEHMSSVKNIFVHAARGKAADATVAPITNVVCQPCAAGEEDGVR